MSLSRCSLESMKSCVTSGSCPSALTIRWMWAGRHGLQPAAAHRAPVGPVERDRVGRREDRADLVAAVVVREDLAAEDALRQPGLEARVEAVGVGVPDVELGAGHRGPGVVGHAAAEDDAIALLVLAPRQLVRRVEDRRVGQVVRAEDGALRAVAVAEDLLLDGGLDEHVEEQRPLAGLADVDQPLLHHAVLLIGHVVLVDHVVDATQHLTDQPRPLGWPWLSPPPRLFGVERRRVATARSR